MDINTDASQVVLIESSTDLHVWEPLLTVPGGLKTISVSDPKAAQATRRFYRIRTSAEVGIIPPPEQTTR